MSQLENLYKVGRLVAVMFFIFLIAVTVKELKSIAYVGANPNQTNTISVDGTGDAYAVPDVATFSFTVTDTEKTVAEAQAKATDKINAALKVVRDAGVADKDIKTDYYSINPHYEYHNAVCPTYATPGSGSVSSTVYCPPGKQVLTGYDVSESVSVKLRDLSKAGSLLTSLGSTGIENLNGPSFEVDNPDSVQAEARGKAIAEAQSKANELAKQLGVKIVRVMSFSENSGGYPRPMAYGMGGADVAVSKAAAAAPEISTGEQKVTSNVNITYEIQ